MAALTRPREGRVIAGVCAGLARRFGISANAMRIIFLVSCLLPGPQFLIYLGAWVLMPRDDKAQSYQSAW
ncbi:PspC domain-containing protein [Streptomyces boninensis]|uniref:PspC domain-containing protein n=1 Tax=Streptomyces boninensis TaxID=2039455 RepID=UPI003B21B839